HCVLRAPVLLLCAEGVRKGHSVRVEDDRWLRAGRQRVRCALADPARFPVIVDDGQFVFEATGNIEYLEARFPETSDLPLAAEVRMWDRFFDNYVSYPQGRLVFMAIGREPDDGKGGAAWKSMVETSYALLDRRMAGRTWAVGDPLSQRTRRHCLFDQHFAELKAQRGMRRRGAPFDVIVGLSHHPFRQRCGKADEQRQNTISDALPRPPA